MDIIKPRIIFHNLKSARNRMNVPNIKLLSDVPKSGWTTTKKKGIKIINIGIIKLWTYLMFSGLISW